MHKYFDKTDLDFFKIVAATTAVVLFSTWLLL